MKLLHKYGQFVLLKHFPGGIKNIASGSSLFIAFPIDVKYYTALFMLKGVFGVAIGLYLIALITPLVYKNKAEL